ncbi:TRAP transporter small permease [Paracoccus methylovorus]|uniref:TRAP transporter small permease protein n=1 Tax=Paracoccus methylovorus TaxID=2812658 RepID=A0ABX7JLE7_9RHOB|nr:TRAP transporter small permease [Paracoccus methylovorus]QRZ14940.1 TRAP transporter small permease [Paracoccus methylovorus]
MVSATSSATSVPAGSIDELAQAFEEDAPEVDLGRYGIEDWMALAVFWGIVGLVFLQFFTRYALNNSVAWTEEVAVAALVVLVFLGSAMCIRLSRHIQVDVLYHYVPASVARWISTGVDILRIAVLGYFLWLMWRYVSLVADERMVSVNITRRWMLYPVVAAFGFMVLRSAQVAWQNWQRGYSALERPEAFDGMGD